MAATGSPQGQARRKEYTNASSADTTTWASPQFMADWVYIEGNGSTVLLGEDGLTSITITTSTTLPNKVMTGPFSGFTSTTASRVTMGNGSVPPAPATPPTAVAALAGSIGGVALTGGLGGGGTAGSPILNVASPNVTGVMPAANAADWADVPTINLVSFTATIATLNAYVFTGGSQTITFPAITSSLQAIALLNMGTGATTAKLAANGTAFFIGGGGATAANPATPASGAAVRYFGSLSQNAWVQGL